MAQIYKGSEVLTLINVFSIRPERQQELIDLLIDATQTTIRHIPGFISANIHRSFDGKSVVNYAQWENKASFEAMLQHPEARLHMQAAAALATFTPILCDVADAINVV